MSVLQEMKECFKQARKEKDLYPDLQGDEYEAWLFFLNNYKWTGFGCVRVKGGIKWN